MRTSKFQKQSKIVSQYNLEGKFIRTFSSSKQAAEATGLVYEYINDAARRKVRTTGNSYWRYGKPKYRINVSKFKSRLQNANRKNLRIRRLALIFHLFVRGNLILLKASNGAIWINCWGSTFYT